MSYLSVLHYHEGVWDDDLFFCLKFNDEKKLMGFHQNLEDVTEDQLSLASIHYMRSHYQEAIDIYKRILLQNR